jgi:hypothetical protein
MRRYFRTEILLIALAFAPDLGVCQTAAQSAAQISVVVPRMIRYSAALPESSQKSGAVGAIFSIYRDQYDGAPLWSETQNLVADKGATYSVLLGSTRNEGLPIDIFSAGEPRWLEAEINGVKEPRVLIGSVPYAMVAADAQTFGGLPPSAYLRASVATATTSSGSGTTTNISAPVVGVKADANSGTPGYLGVFTNGTDLGNSVLFQNGNTISIGGTTSLGAMTLIGNAPSGDTAGMVLYNSGGGGGASVSVDMYNTYANGGIPQAKIKAVDDGAFSDHLTFWTKNPGAAGNPVAERVRITSIGNVGIGTTSPAGKLEVAGNLKISGVGSALIFQDGSLQTTALITNVTNGSTASGSGALPLTGIGLGNTAMGSNALHNNNVGSANTGTGADALRSNTSGSGNTANGSGSLSSNTTGYSNTAMGSQSLQANTTGYANTAVGIGALLSNTTGNANTAFGNAAGILVNGSNNIEIANQGAGADDHVIRIGDVQTQTFIAGISGVNVSGVPVVVSSSGQLGIASSSRRYKEDIQDMGDATTALMRLRPVTYHYKQPYSDGSKPLEYGLIAEEVADIYPELVAHSQDGKIETVMYQKLTPMLLNEVQRLQAQNASQSAEIHRMEERLARLEALLQHSEDVDDLLSREQSRRKN